MHAWPWPACRGHEQSKAVHHRHGEFAGWSPSTHLFCQPRPPSCCRRAYKKASKKRFFTKKRRKKAPMIFCVGLVLFARAWLRVWRKAQVPRAPSCACLQFGSQVVSCLACFDCFDRTARWRALVTCFIGGAWHRRAHACKCDANRGKEQLDTDCCGRPTQALSYELLLACIATQCPINGVGAYECILQGACQAVGVHLKREGCQALLESSDRKTDKSTRVRNLPTNVCSTSARCHSVRVYIHCRHQLGTG